jgi:hypothetical protein
MSAAGTPAGAPRVSAGALIVAGFPCCRVAECRCDCGCTEHPEPAGRGHYRRCASCAHGFHAGPRVPLPIRAAQAFGELPRAPYERLAHLLPAGPREVEQ